MIAYRVKYRVKGGCVGDLIRCPETRASGSFRDNLINKKLFFQHSFLARLTNALRALFLGFRYIGDSLTLIKNIKNKNHEQSRIDRRDFV
jgi:hypothetical protein